MNEKTLTTETVYKGGIITVVKDAVELPNGNTADREVVKHSGGVCVVPLADNDTVILVKQYRHPFKQAILELPAGKLEHGESPLECGKRELLEEAGCTAERFEYMGKLYPTPAYCTEVIHMYLARGLCEGDNNLDKDEFLETVKLPFDKVIDMIFQNEICDAKTQLAMLKTKILLNN